MEIIQVKNAFKSYHTKFEKTPVLNGLSMKVQRGTIYSMMGSSGCGKTTLISCLVGARKLDGGEIKIFGEPLKKSQNLRIGFMPQETALVGEFKIKEMFWFFGTIFGLKTAAIEEKFKTLSTLLELPDEERLVRNCSGGQQRRISFAVTLIHDPDLLILDEPTVGVDPLLRERVWEYLVHLTQTKNVTILLSTHYIEEARQSNQIGLMRNGVLIAENTPHHIMQACETTNMEEAFLKLSQQQEVGGENSNYLANNFEVQNFDSNPSTSKLEIKSSSMRNQQIYPKILTALLMKHYLETVRNFGYFFIAIIALILMCIGLNFGIGGKLSGLTLGVVNDEVATLNECHNSSLKTYELQRFDCSLQKTSCRFIQNFDQNVAELKFYENYDEAFHDAKKTKILGFLYFSSNFTKSLPLFNDAGVEDDLTDDGTIQVFLDNTNLQELTLIKKELYDTYQRFMERIMVDCGKSKKAGNTPIVFETLFGEIDFNMKITMNVGFTLAIFFILAAITTSTSMVDERASGIWNRAIVAGVKPHHFLISHLIKGFIIMFIQFIEVAIYVLNFLLPSLTLKSMILLLFILLLTGIAGIFFGIFVSSVVNNVSSSMHINQSFVKAGTFVCGIIWPIQGFPKFLKALSYAFPFTFSTVVFRTLPYKDVNIFDTDVLLTLLVLIAWIVIPFVLSLWLTKKKSV